MKTKFVHSNSSASLASFSGFSNPNNSQARINPTENGTDEYYEGVKIEYNHKDLDYAGPSLAERVFRKKNLERTFPILKWGRTYTKQKCISDLIAGITVGLTVLPQGLAYATVAGLPPIYGLYSSFVGCFVYIFFGSTKAITIGPTAIQSILTYKYTYGKPPEYAVFLCFVTAVVTLLMGIFRLGFIANFISAPVISGFTSGVALTIVATQLKSLLGLHFDKEGFLPTMIGVFEHIREVHKWDTILSIIGLSTYMFLKYLQAFVGLFVKTNLYVDKTLWVISTARSAIIIIVATVYVMITDSKTFTLVGKLGGWVGWNWAYCTAQALAYNVLFIFTNQQTTGCEFGKIAPGLPAFQPPPFSIFDASTNTTHSFGDIISEEASALLVLPLLGVMGHITIAKAFSGSDRVDCTQEILCIGISNAISCFFSSYSIGGSFSRTTVNAMSGAESPAGGAVTGLMVILALQFLTPYFAYIPKASLAAIISGSVIFMVDPKIILPLWRSKKMDMLPWALTVLITLFVGLEFGIMTGLLISVLYLLYYAARPRVKIMQGETAQGNKFTLIVLDRSMTFPSVDHITYEITKAVDRWGNQKIPVVLDCHHIQYADYTAAESIRDMIGNLKKEKHDLVFWKLKRSILRVLLGVMYGSGIAFVHCHTETDVEAIIDNAASAAGAGDNRGNLSVTTETLANWSPVIPGHDTRM